MKKMNQKNRRQKLKINQFLKHKKKNKLNYYLNLINKMEIQIIIKKNLEYNFN